jgi:uncharacterized Zn-binding protein involved in type VI secretion
MGTPAIVQNDQIRGMCAIHQVPSPSSGAPQPSPGPLHFSAPLISGLAATVKIGGRPAAVTGSSGMNTPAHVGLHASDPFATPSRQEGRVLSGSPTVRFGGQQAANASSSVTCCSEPGSLVPTVANVMIG